MNDASTQARPGQSDEDPSRVSLLATTDHLRTMDSVAAAGVGTSPADRPARGERRFTVLAPHAEGGLGRVHLARDEQLHRSVALKEIRPERADDPHARQRFLNEAEITGQLEHPGIVPVYALEHDADGRPVYAMRFIQGRTLGDAIDDYHRQPTPLGLRDLLQRFITVCQTVAFAHSKGVIHRDLKPANVLLGDYGETLVVDWGLAKRLGVLPPPAGTAAQPPEPIETVDYVPADACGSGEQVTLAGQVLGTPAYMAPEQARGEALGSAADVYALGAILYKLLTGQAPYTGRNALEVIQQVQAGPPPSRTRRRGTPRPLEAVCLKAMARNAGQRYATAAELARDVEHFLADEPVSAYREPVAVRLGRWARRHRTLVTSLGVAAVLLLAVGGGVAWWQGRLAEERRVERAGNAQQIEALLKRAEDAIVDDDAPAAGLAVGEAVKRAEKPGADHLRDRLDRCRVIAGVLAELDRVDDLRCATEGGKFHGNARAVQEWPGVFARLGLVLGQTPPAEAADAVNRSLARERLLTALDTWLVEAPAPDRAALAGVLAAADPDSFRDAVRAALQRSDETALKALAARDEALRQPARFTAALGSLGALPMDRRLAILGASAHARPRDFTVLMTAGFLYEANDRTTAAERAAWFRSAVTVRPGSSAARNELGNCLLCKGDLDGAIAEFRAAIDLDPKFALPHNNLGNALGSKGELDGAVAAYRAALALDPKFALAHNNLGAALYNKGDLDGAVAEYRAAIALKYPWSHCNLGNALWAKGDLDGAVPEYRAAIALHPMDAGPHNGLGRVHARLGQWQEAAASLARAVELDPNEHYYAFQLGFVMAERGDLPAYRQYCKTLLSRWGKTTDPILADRTAMACLILPGGVEDPDQLAPLRKTVLSEGEKHSFYMYFLGTQGLHDYRCGRFSEALTACRKSRERSTTYLALTVLDQTVEAMSLFRLGKSDEARQVLAAVGRLLDAKGPRLESGDLGTAWNEWLLCRMLRREAAALIDGKEPVTPAQKEGKR